MATKRAPRRKRVVADTSSLILLAKSGLLEQVVSKLQVVVPERVYEEAVVRGKTKGQADAFQLETHFRAKRLQKKRPKRARGRAIQELFNLRAGERDALALAQELGIDEVLMDDKKGISACKALGLRFATALDVLVALYKQGIIGKAKALEALGQLQEYGWYSKTLLEQARRDLDAG